MPRAHRSVEETRTLVAEAIVDYVAHHGIAVWPEIPMERILESAGVSRASAYRIWPGRSAFGTFALEQCLAGHAMATLDEQRALALAREVLGEAPTVTASRVDSAARFIARAAEEELDLLLSSDRWRAFVRFQAVALDAPTPEIQELLDRIDTEDAARLQAVYASVAEVWGLAPVIAGGTSAIAEAALLLARSAVARIVAGRSEGRLRSTYATALAALVRGSFREVPQGAVDLERLTAS